MSEQKETLTDSRKLTLDQLIYSLNQLDAANEAIDKKAIALLQVASLGWFLLLFFTPVAYYYLFLFPLVIIFTVYILFPRTLFAPGTHDWGELYADYIYKNSEECFDQVLDDYFEVMTKLSPVNKHKSKAMQVSAILFFIQILVISILVRTGRI